MEISTTDIKKRVRSANWDEGEKRLLNQLILQRIHVLENKDTSTNTNALKKAAWQDVLSCFNSLNNKKRNIKELMTQWRNTKGKVKSRDSQYKRAKLITGGGPPPPSPPAEDLAIINAMPNEFTVDINCFDSDSLHAINERQIQSPTVGKPEKGMDLEDHWTPLAPSIDHTKESEKTDKDVPVPDFKKVLIATPTSESKQTRDMRKGLKPQNKKNTNYEQELFLLAKQSKERENERAEEIHRKRMAILELEYEYWKKKINKIE